MANLLNKSYLPHATHAADLEKKGRYSEAAFAWQVANNHAVNPINSHWAQARADYCLTQSRG